MKIEFSDSFYRKLRKIGNAVAEREAKKISSHLTSYAKTAIGEYYERRKPDYYQRTDTLRKKSYHPYFETTKNGKNNVYHGGVKFDFLEPTPYYPTDKFIIEHTIMNGLHGYRKNKGTYGNDYIPIQTLPTPWDMVKRERNRMVNGKSAVMKQIKSDGTKYGISKFLK